MKVKNPPGRPATVVSKGKAGIDEIKEHNKAAFGEKIRALRKQRGLTQPQLAMAIGVTKNAVGNWELGFTRPELAYIAKLCEALEISADVFFGIPNRSSQLEEGELEHILLYRALNKYEQSSVDVLMKAIKDNSEKAFREECRKNCLRLMRVDLAYSVGTGNPLDNTYESEPVYLHKSRNAIKADAIVTVTGDSMQPTFYDGDDLLIERTESVESGEIGIFIVAGDGFVKEYQPDGLHSHNHKYKTIRPTEDDNARCVGRVLGTVTDEMYVTDREEKALGEIYAQMDDD